jgi:hypothetical protein
MPFTVKTRDAILFTFYSTSGETQVLVKAMVDGPKDPKIKYCIQAPSVVRFERVRDERSVPIGADRYGI